MTIIYFIENNMPTLTDKIIREAVEEFDNKFSYVEGEDFQGWIVNKSGERNLPWDEDRDGLKSVKSFLETKIRQAIDETIKTVVEQKWHTASCNCQNDDECIQNLKNTI